MKLNAPGTESKSLKGKETVQNLIKKGLISVEDLSAIVEEQAALRKNTRDASSIVLANVEFEPDKRISFTEAVKYLEGKLDLEAALTDAVKSHNRWGLVDALVQAGAIKDASEYGALFDKVTVNEADLRKVSEMLECGKKVLPIFDAGEMTPAELFAILFTDGGVPYCTRSSYSCFKNLVKLRRIDPKDIPDLANLAEKPHFKQVAAFKAAYKEVDPLEPTGVARILFTPDKRNGTSTVRTATQDMQAYAKGEMKFLDPNADFYRYRAQMDAGLRKIAEKRGNNFDDMDNAAYRIFLDKAFADKTIDRYMPDRNTFTGYPNYAFKNGGFPFISFNAGHRELFVHDGDFASYGVGRRVALG